MPKTLDDSFFRALFHSQLGGIAVADLTSLSIIDVNEVLLELIGLAREEVVGVADVGRRITPPEYLHLDEQALQQVQEYGHCQPYEKEFQRPDASRVPVRVSTALVSNFPDKLIIFVTDMTAEHAARDREKAVQQRLEIAVSAAEQGVWDFDLITREMVYSDRAKEIYGLPPEHPVTFELIRDATHPEDLPYTHSQLERAIDPAIRDRNKYEYRIIRPDGTICWALAHGEAVFEGPSGQEKAVRYAGTIQDITAQKLAERHQNVLVAELNHRVKNVLAIVQSLAFQTLRGQVPEEVADNFAGRLAALASAHDLLTEAHWEGANLRDIAVAAIEPIAPDLKQVVIGGEDVQLTPQMAVSLSMAFHELATNAAKYGALSSEHGRVELSWRLEPEAEKRLRIRWREHDGPPVEAPQHEGFGTRMIRRVIGSNLRGNVAVHFHADGAECLIEATLGDLGLNGPAPTSAQAFELAR